MDESRAPRVTLALDQIMVGTVVDGRALQVGDVFCCQDAQGVWAEYALWPDGPRPIRSNVPGSIGG